MPDMRRFLEPNTTFSRVILIVLPIIGVIFAVIMAVFMISAGFELFMIPMMVTPFLLLTVVCIFLLGRNKSTYLLWWNSLSETERAEIEQDYSSAEPVNNYLILGRQYAFIRGISRPILYDDIEDINFVSVKGGWNMFVVLNGGQKLVTCLPIFCNRQVVWAELMQRCGRDVF